MIYLTNKANKEIALKYGFHPYRTVNSFEDSNIIFEKNMGTMRIWINWNTREITGYGFYPISDGMICNVINDFIKDGFAEISK